MSLEGLPVAMKDSSVIQTIISNPTLLAEVQSWVGDWPAVSLVTADAGLTLDEVDLMLLDWDAYACSGVVAELKHSNCPWVVLSDQPSIEQELQVLAEGENIHASLLTRAHTLLDFFIILTETEHD